MPRTDFDVDFSPMPTERFVEELGKKTLLKKELIARYLGDAGYTIAWTMARAADVRTMREIRRSLQQAVIDGIPFRQWYRKRLPAVFASLGIDPMSPWYMETVMRTTLATTFEATRYMRITEDPEVEWLVYDAINDDRVRDDHLEMDGLAWPRDQFPPELWPPNGYNCRCTVIPASSDELGELGARPVMGEVSSIPSPDEGFNAPPSFSALTEAVRQSLARELDMLTKGL